VCEVERLPGKRLREREPWGRRGNRCLRSDGSASQRRLPVRHRRPAPRQEPGNQTFSYRRLKGVTGIAITKYMSGVTTFNLLSWTLCVTMSMIICDTNTLMKQHIVKTIHEITSLSTPGLSPAILSLRHPSAGQGNLIPNDGIPNVPVCPGPGHNPGKLYHPVGPRRISIYLVVLKYCVVCDTMPEGRTIEFQLVCLSICLHVSLDSRPIEI
jgi:hypothetical protein